MPNLLEKINLIDPNNDSYTINLQDAGTLALVTNNITDIGALQGNVKDIQDDITSIQGDITSIQGDVTSIQGDVTSIQGDVTSIQGDITNLKTNIVYNTTYIKNLDNTGTTDCSSILSNITNNIGLQAGTYLIDSDCTINAQVVFAKGALFNVTSGHTLTINGQILAGRYQIFSGSGSIVVNEGIQDFGYPEWFNDDVAKCYETFRHIKLGYKTYTINGNLFLNKSNTCIEGISYPTQWTENCSRLSFNNGRLVIGTYTTTVINEFPRNITIKNMQISSNYSGDTISIYGIVRAILEGIYIYTETGNTGIAFYRAIGAILNNIYVQSVGISGVFYGYRFYDESGTGAIGARSASVWLKNCTYSDTNPQNGNTYGFHVGSHHSDIFMDNCEVATANHGLLFDTLIDSYSLDFLINNCDFDSCRSDSISIYHCNNASISISNCYCANDSTSTTPVVICDNSTCNLAVSNLQIVTTNASQIGFNNTGALHAILSGLDITGPGTSYSSSNNTYILAQYLDKGTPVKIPT